VAITGHDSPETHARAIDLGAAAYLCKPVDGEELVAANNAAIDRSAQTAACTRSRVWLIGEVRERPLLAM